MAPAMKAFSLHVVIFPLFFLFASVATSQGGVCRPAEMMSIPSSEMKQLTYVQGTVFFTLDYIGNSYLFKTNGSPYPSGILLVKNIYPGGDANLGELTEVDGALFFVGTDAEHMRELWKSDGTAAGTVLVKSLTSDFSPTNLTNVNGNLFFSANDSLFYGSGRELWKRDGTGAGTFLVKDINPGTASSNPSDLTAIGSILFFVADDGTHGRELWRSDDTGTALVADIGLSYLDSDPAFITQKGIAVLFSATKEGFGRELWISLLGLTPSQLKNINPEDPEWADSNPAYLTKCGETVFFAATKSDDVTERELWKTNGTEAGTMMVKNINPAPGASSNPMDLICMGGMVYFRANDGAHELELWVSDGTEAGTTMVKDLHPSGGSSPNNFVNANGTLYFATLGGNLWKCEEEFPWELFIPAFIHRD